MVNYLSAVKLTKEIETLVRAEQKNYCFIIAENAEDEERQIAAHSKQETIFIIVRKDRWQTASEQKKQMRL